MSSQFKIGVNAILIKDNKVLLGKRLAKAGFGQWGVPGGHLEYQELMTDGVKRELKEETGLEAVDLQFAQLINDPTQDDHYIQVNFLVTSWTGNLEIKEPDRCEKWEWFDLNHLPENIFYGHAKFLPLYKEGKNFADIKNNTLNIYSKSDDLRARILSNFSHHPFMLNGQHFASVEGFIQGIAFPEGDMRRIAAFNAWGSDAKKFAVEQERKFVWWGGKEIIFGSPEEHGIIEQALRAKFEQNPEAKEALISTKGLQFTHILPEPESANTCLPASVFCMMLMKIRDEI